MRGGRPDFSRSGVPFIGVHRRGIVGVYIDVSLCDGVCERFLCYFSSFQVTARCEVKVRLGRGARGVRGARCGEVEPVTSQPLRGRQSAKRGGRHVERELLQELHLFPRNLRCVLVSEEFRCVQRRRPEGCQSFSCIRVF